jgi:hypothetical protein
MLKTRKPIVAGVIDVICGTLGFFWGLVISLFGIFGVWVEGGRDYAGVFLIASISAVHIILAILALWGGINTIKRKQWSLAVGGSIASSLLFLPLGIFLTFATIIYSPLLFLSLLGIVATVLTILSKSEFE